MNIKPNEEPKLIMPVFLKKKPKSKKLTLPTAELTRNKFEDMVTSIAAHWFKNPTMTTKQLWNRYKNRLLDITDLVNFKRNLLRAGLTKSKVASMGSTKQAVNATLETLSTLKARMAEEHQRRMASYVDKAHKVVEKIEPTIETVDAYIATASSLNTLGRKTFDIQEEIQKNDKVAALSVLLSFDPDTPPTEKIVQAEVVEPSH